MKEEPVIDQTKAMRMTEKEARDRLCPMRIQNTSVGSPCAGSKCMAWRWVGKDTITGFCGLCPQFPSH